MSDEISEEQRLARAKSMVESGIAVDLETALLIGEPKPHRTFVEVWENGVKRECTDDRNGS